MSESPRKVLKKTKGRRTRRKVVASGNAAAASPSPSLSSIPPHPPASNKAVAAGVETGSGIGRLTPALIVSLNAAAASHRKHSGFGRETIRLRKNPRSSLFDPESPFLPEADRKPVITRWRCVFLLPHQHRAAYMSGRFQVWVCGRRWGKTYLNLQLLAAFLLSASDRHAWWIGPTMGQAQFIWREALRLLRGRIATQSKTWRRIELDNRSSLEVHSAEQGNNLRGVGLDRIVVDEAALVSEEIWNNILRPMLSISGGGAVMASTPAGHNWFFDAYRRGGDESYPEWNGLRAPTSENPLVGESDLDEARVSMTDAGFRQEFLAQFVADDSSAFPSVRDCVRSEKEMPASTGAAVVGVDWGLVGDYTVAAALDPESLRLLAYDRFRGVSVNEAIIRVADFCRRFAASCVVADATGLGEGLVAGLLNAGIPVEPLKFTVFSKTRLMIELTLAIERRELSLPEDEILLSELEACRREVSRHGDFRVAAPNNGHDDIVDALSLAVYAAKFSLRKPPPADFIEPPFAEGVFYL